MRLFFAKFKCVVFGRRRGALTFTDFAFENLDAQRIENFSLQDGATQKGLARRKRDRSLRARSKAAESESLSVIFCCSRRFDKRPS